MDFNMGIIQMVLQPSEIQAVKDKMFVDEDTGHWVVP